MRQEEGGGDSETDECVESPVSTASSYNPLSVSDEKTEEKCSTNDNLRQDLNEEHSDVNTHTGDRTSSQVGDAGESSSNRDSFNIPSPPGSFYKRRVSQDCSKSSDVSLFAHRQLPEESLDNTSLQRSSIERVPLVSELRTESGSLSCSTQTVISLSSLSPWDEVEFVSKRTLHLKSPNVGTRFPSNDEKLETGSMQALHSKITLENPEQQRSTISNAKQPNQAVLSPDNINVYRNSRPLNRQFLTEHSPNINSSLHLVGQKSNGTTVPESPGSSSGYSTTGSADSPRDLTLSQQESLVRKSLETYNQSAIQTRAVDQPAALPVSHQLGIHARSPKSYEIPINIVDNPSVKQKPYMHSVPIDTPSHSNSNDLGVKVEQSPDSCCDHYYNSNMTPNLNSDDQSDRIVPARVGSSRDDEGGEGRTDGRSRRRSGIATKDTHACQVCGEVAAGFHCGAYICEACKVMFQLTD